MNRAVIGVGSNIDPVENIMMARIEVEQAVTIINESDFIETEPLGFAAQANFINGAWLVETDKEVTDLSQQLKDIEHKLGRVRDPNNKNGPRTIDLDIVVWNNRVVDDDVHTRDFLRRAVSDLVPSLFTD